MRRLPFTLSAVITVLTLGFPLTWPLPAAASGNEAPLIVAGRLVDPSGRPTSGELELLAWPTGRQVTVGDRVDLQLVDRAQAGPSGDFSVRSPATPALVAAAEANGGYVNFELRAVRGRLSQEIHFSRYLGETPARGFAAWSAAPGEPAPPVTLQFLRSADVEGTPADTPVVPNQGGCYGMKVVDSQVGDTIIGELRTPPGTLEASFVYGERADSDISVATRVANGPWSASGSHHISDANGAAVTQRAANGQHLIVRSRFVYDKYEYVCAGGRREKIVPREWFGDVMPEPAPPRGCATAAEMVVGHYGPQTNFDRQQERAVRWEVAATVFDVTFSAQSGYSEFVRAHWKFGAEPDHLLCGDDGKPAKASRIFAGPSA